MSSIASASADVVKPLRIALVYPGDVDSRKVATTESNPRFAPLFAKLLQLENVHAEPCVYHPNVKDEVTEQLSNVDAALVWVNPLQDGYDREAPGGLNDVLRHVHDKHGVFVSTHPDMIQKIGRKDVLYHTKSMTWSGDTGDVHLYTSLTDLQRELPLRLKQAPSSSSTPLARVLKCNRGQSGSGVYKVTLKETNVEGVNTDTMLLVRHAERGALEQTMTFGDFLQLASLWFDGNGDDHTVIDQPYQERLAEGMIRCYLVHDKVAGFGHQAINALYPAATSDPNEPPPQPGPRLYHPPDWAPGQALKVQLETEWIPQLQTLLDIASPNDLPVLWDTDFLLGTPKRQEDGGIAVLTDTYVLCEINVSSVSPYPDSATPFIAQAVLAAAQRARFGINARNAQQ